MFKILEIIVDEYIRTGEPIGSKTIQEKLDISISSATVRNEMASLEAQGYLDSPHTSSGRIPTIKGYKLYIERMTPENKPGLNETEKSRIDSFFSDKINETDEALIESASRALAEVTKCAIVSTSAASRFSVITKVEVIPTGKRMYVLLLITSSGNIKNKVCRLSFDLTHEQMDFFIKFINENLEGLGSEDLSDEFIENLATALGSYMMTLSPLFKAVADLSKELRGNDIKLEGEANLIACSELEKNAIVTLLESKNEFAELLENAFSGINVMFGSETGTFAVQNSSMITGGFNKDGKPAGSFGVIGPVRLNYKKIIPYIEYFTNKMTDILSSEKSDNTDIENNTETMTESEGTEIEK